MRALLCLAGPFLLLSMAASLPAEPGAILVGLITGARGEAVRGARVTMRDLDSGKLCETNTNESGIYAFSGLPAGRYRFQVSKAHFEPLDVAPVHLGPGETRSVRLKLTPQAGGLTQRSF